EYGSVPASLFIVGKQLGDAEFEYGEELDSRVVVSPWSGPLARSLPAVLGCTILLIAIAFCLRQRRSSLTEPTACRRFGAAILTTLGTVLLFAPVFSPQYVLWLLPGVLLLIGVSNWIVGAAVILGLCIQIQFPIIEGLPPSVKDWALAGVLVVRN